MIRAILWDMDGVIVNSEDHHHAGEIATFKHFGVEIPEEVNKQYKGTPLREHFQGLKDQFEVETPLEDLLNKQNEHIQNMYSIDVELFDGIEEVLVDLKNNYKQALATSSERRLVDIILKRFGLDQIFDEITCGDEISKGKPDPEIFLKSAEKLEVSPEECLVVEDSLNGMKAGKAAGMKVIAHKVSHNKDLDFSLADFVVGDLREIPKIVESLDGTEGIFSQSSKNKTVGIIGGGQLGRMMVEASLNLDLKIVVLEPTENPPAAQAGAEQIVGSLTDPEKIKELASKSDFTTWEIEHINTEILEELEARGYKINPSPKTLATIKDKYLQKEFLRRNAIPTADFKKVESVEDIKNAAADLGLPLLLKTRFGGYDGRGNHVIHDEEDIESAFARLGKEGLYVEGFVEFEKELAIMAARDSSGNIKTYPVVETIHENNILHLTLAPAPIPESQFKQAEDFAKKVLEHLGGAGVFGIEMFLTKSGEILVNEIAPRVHNSGHYTIEACETSQFENQLRAVSEMELGDTSMKFGAAVMVNILGERNGVAEPKGIEEAEKLGDVFVHIYGKKDVKIERKMGHITVLGENLEEVLQKTNLARSLIRL